MAAHLAPYRYAPGDNGGTHRGPDHFPRKRVVQAIVMGALADEGFVPIRDRETGKRLYRLGGDEAVRPSRFALVELIRERLKRIARRGSDRDVLTMVRDMHQILQDPKGEAAEAVEPRRVTFVAEPAALQERQAAEPIKGGGPSSIRMPDGQEYVEG